MAQSAGFIEIGGKVALVTGGARRLGASVCRALALEGVHVIVHFNRSRGEAEQLCGELRGHQVHAWGVQGDFGAASSCPSFWERAVAEAGPVDFLINNASIFPSRQLGDMTAAEVHENVEVNALVPFELGRLFAAQKRAGCIVNFLDTRAFDYDREHVPYHLSKRMLHTLTRIMALEFAPGIRVNAVAPGLVLPPAGKDETYLDALAHTNPLHRFGSPEGIAQAVVFLLRSSFITGQTLYIDGGRHLRANLYG